jgi:predicted nuclease with TOPRIM domain
MKPMNRPLLLLAAFSLASCREAADNSGDFDDLDLEDQLQQVISERDDLLEKVEEAERKFDYVTERITKLGYEIDEFDSENWRDNVRDVTYEFEQLKSEADDVDRVCRY